MTDISDDAVRAFMAAEVPGILDEHLDLAVKSVDGDRVRAGLAAALPYLLDRSVLLDIAGVRGLVEGALDVLAEDDRSSVRATRYALKQMDKILARMPDSSDTPPYLLEQDRTEEDPVPTCGVCGRPVDVADLAPPTVSMVEVPDRPGLVVRPVLNKRIRMDPETGAVCWCREAP